MPMKLTRVQGKVAEMTVEVQIGPPDRAVPQIKKIKGWAEETLNQFFDTAKTPVLCIRVVSMDESKSLNEKFRGQNIPTNVLSFPEELVVDGMQVIGDIVICAPVVNSEARSIGRDMEDQFSHMVVHGVLHLCGYDHIKKNDEKIMMNYEKFILNEIGIKDPYISYK